MSGEIVIVGPAFKDMEGLTELLLRAENVITVNRMWYVYRSLFTNIDILYNSLCLGCHTSKFSNTNIMNSEMLKKQSVKLVRSSYPRLYPFSEHINAVTQKNPKIEVMDKTRYFKICSLLNDADVNEGNYLDYLRPSSGFVALVDTVIRNPDHKIMCAGLSFGGEKCREEYNDIYGKLPTEHDFDKERYKYQQLRNKNEVTAVAI